MQKLYIKQIENTATGIWPGQGRGQHNLKIMKTDLKY